MGRGVVGAHKWLAASPNKNWFCLKSLHLVIIENCSMPFSCRP